MSGSSRATRWGAPLLLIAAMILLSVVVAFGPAPWRWAPNTRLPALGLLPLVATVLAVGVRLSIGVADRGADLVLVWLLTFVGVAGALVLLAAIGVEVELARSAPWAGAGLIGGLGPLMAGLEPDSPRGVRTAATRRSPEAWRRGHRRLAIVFGLGALLAVGLGLRWPDAAIASLAVTVVLGLLAAEWTARGTAPPA